jgi:3-methyladenine DNA glycosylase AlkC
LPGYRDENGDLLLPAEYEGRPVEGHDGEYLLGPLDQWNNDQSALVRQLSRESVRESLSQVEWDTADADEVLAALVRLG